MNIEHKSLKLVELMGWVLFKESVSFYDTGKTATGPQLCPYEDTVEGRAQFAAILLQFPEVMQRVDFSVGHRNWQEYILDEILAMHHLLD